MLMNYSSRAHGTIWDRGVGRHPEVFMTNSWLCPLGEAWWDVHGTDVQTQACCMQSKFPVLCTITLALVSVFLNRNCSNIFINIYIVLHKH